MTVPRLGLFLSLLILFSYQNCVRPKEIQGPLTIQSIGLKLEDEDVQKVTFFDVENIILEKSSKTFTLVSQISYSVDFISGEVIKSSDKNSEQNFFCLTNSLLSELKNIINLSSVCKVELTPDSSRVCALVYQPGYALLVTNRDSFDLGSSSDGCGSVRISLCEPSSEDMLKGWLQAVRNQLPQLSCPE